MKKTIYTSILIFVFLTGCTPQVEKQTYTVGIAGWNSDDTYGQNIEGFKKGLESNHFIEGKNVEFITHFAESNTAQQGSIIEAFIQRDVDLIYSLTTPGTLIAKNLTQSTPIVFSIVTYPEEAGVIESTLYSGNNLVGTRNYVSLENQFYTIEKVFPTLKTVIFAHRKDEPNSEIQFTELSVLFKRKKIDLIKMGAVDVEDLKSQLDIHIFAADAVYLACDTLINNGGEEVVISVSNNKLVPTFGCLKSSVEKGATMGIVSDFHDIGAVAGRKAALILQGAHPSSLLTESGSKEFLVVNSKTTELLGITIPAAILRRADEII
jgi:putative tryptophan/tyrosine transport system substrate-binding protein